MEDELKLLKSVAIIAAIVVVVAIFVRYVLPYVVAVGVLWLAYRVYVMHREHPATQAREARKRAQALYQTASVLQNGKLFPDVESCQKTVMAYVKRHSGDKFPALEVVACALDIIRQVLEREGLFEIAPPPTDGTLIDYARYQDATSELIRKFECPDTAKLVSETLGQSIAWFAQCMPALAKHNLDTLLADAENESAHLAVRLIDTLPNVPDAVEALVTPFYAERLKAIGLFSSLREQLDSNMHDASGIPYTPMTKDSPKLLLPHDYKGSGAEIVYRYLKNTGFEELFEVEVPFDIPEVTRFEHHWIVAGSGHGKSQTLQYLIANDLDRVAKGGASVVVIDSQGDLIKNIAGLKVFAEGEPLHGKLCLIDPTDIEYPVALNLFDVGMERINQYSELNRERLLNGVLELYDFVLGSLLSAELTSKQGVIFRYITRLMLHIPGATIHTFRELMEPGGYDKYLPYIETLEGTARAFFETEFRSKQFEDTKRQVVRRLWGILENRTFERMFTHPKNKLDLFSEMNAGKVILINTAKELLKQNGTEIFGRFFIALIAQAAQERATLDKNKRTPTFVYIDECADYLDQNVALILEQARKFNVGMILANQYVGQLSQKLQESFAANTSIKFAGGVSDKDAKYLSHMLRCTPEFIDAQPKGYFAASVRNLTATAVSLCVPFGYLEAMPCMSPVEFDRVRAEVRERYAVYWKDVGRTDDDQVTQGVAEPEVTVTPNQGDPTAAGAW